jgi:hypothetical protein
MFCAHTARFDALGIVDCYFDHRHPAPIIAAGGGGFARGGEAGGLPEQFAAGWLDYPPIFVPGSVRESGYDAETDEQQQTPSNDQEVTFATAQHGLFRRDQETITNTL